VRPLWLLRSAAGLAMPYLWRGRSSFALGLFAALNTLSAPVQQRFGVASGMPTRRGVPVSGKFGARHGPAWRALRDRGCPLLWTNSSTARASRSNSSTVRYRTGPSPSSTHRVRVDTRTLPILLRKIGLDRPGVGVPASNSCGRAAGTQWNIRHYRDGRCTRISTPGAPPWGVGMAWG